MSWLQQQTESQLLFGCRPQQTEGLVFKKEKQPGGAAGARHRRRHRRGPQRVFWGHGWTTVTKEANELFNRKIE